MNADNTAHFARLVRGPGKTLVRMAFLAAILVRAIVPAHAAPTADSLLQRVEATWQANQTLTAEFTATTQYPTYYRDSQERGTITLARPNQVAIRLDRYRKLEAGERWQAMGNVWTSVSDGTTQGTLLQHPDSAQYRKTAAPASPDKLLENVEPLNGFFSGHLPAHDEAHALGVKPWEGADYQVVETRTKQGKRIAQLYIGADGLIHRLLVEDRTLETPVRREVALRNLRLNSDVSASGFALTLPEGAQPFERVPAQTLLAAGDEAPDFTVQDAEGRPVRLSDLRGSVVVLEFFATWCGSCRQSLPHTQQVLQQFAGKKVTTLLVDIWDSEKALRTWQRRSGSKYPSLHFAVDPAPQGKDIATKLYHVSTTPTLYVIGADGKVAAALAGYDGPTPALQQAIQAALPR